MPTFTPTLSGKGLLAASIALLSGAALAETAGRVTFVSGDASATAADGISRTLRRGDAISGGDRISTRAGRLQIRFTDGGFVSLQPNSVFGVDEYLYSNRQPEETSLFFSLLQGGMRTLTGTIGRVNKQSYKVRTPVATIGIRGTEYLASLGEDGLRVSVGAGFVSVENGQGNVTGGAGQNILVPGPDNAPQLSDEKAALQASSIDGDLLPEQEEQDESAEEPAGAATVAIGNVQTATGDYIYLFTTEARLQSSDLATGSPRYFFNTPEHATSSNGGDGLLVTFGTPLKAYTAAANADPAKPDFDSGTLEMVNVQTVGGLSWGEFTDGISAVNNVFDDCGDGCLNPISLASTQFLPYVVGLAPVGNLGKGVVTYTLQGGTAPRNNLGNVGTLDSFVIKVDLDFTTLDLKMKLFMPSLASSGQNNTYTVTTLNDAPVAIADIGVAEDFFLDSGMLSVSDSDSTCTSGSSFCSATLSGFFAGVNSKQIGASYTIENFSGSAETITGVAALGNTSGQSVVPATAADGPGYSLAFAKTDSLGSDAGFLGGYQDFFSDSSLTNTFDSSGLKQADQVDPSNTPELLRSTAQADDAGRQGTLDWGRWYGGDIAASGTVATLGPDQSLHYITGPMTSPDFFSIATQQYGVGSTATYTFQNGTTATGTDGSAGTITSGSSLTVTFGSNPLLDIDLGISMSGGSGPSGLYQISGSGLGTNVLGGQASFSAITGEGITLSGDACASGCGLASASINGFFSGAQAQQIGLSYQISDIGRTVSGVSAFGRGDITPPPSGPALVLIDSGGL